MALTNCQECGNAISDKAEICPHCGYTYVRRKSIPEFEESKEAAMLKIIAFIVYIVAFICGILMGRTKIYYYEYQYMVGTMLAWWFGGFVTGTFILGFRKIINLLQEIRDKQ